LCVFGDVALLYLLDFDLAKWCNKEEEEKPTETEWYCLGTSLVGSDLLEYIENETWAKI
jgi:hypothetical protein